jgi:LysM repeat protein
MKTRTVLRAGAMAAAAISVVAAFYCSPAAAQERPETRTEYIVRSGDTLFSLSRQFETTVDMLKRANGLADDRIRVGQKLLIPIPNTEPETVPAAVFDQRSQRADSVATPKDQPDSIEEPPGDSLGILRTETGVDAVTVGPDDVSTLADTTAAAVGESAVADSATAEIDVGFLEVTPGQSLYEIAFATGLPVDSLKALNPGLPGFFPDSARLVVPAAYASVRYVVKRGDTLFKIAREFGTTVAAIRTANSLPGDIIHVGQGLTVPSARVVVDASDASLPLIGEGEARVYPGRFAGRLTAGGRPYDPEEYTISHRDLPIGSIVLVKGSRVGRRAFAEVTDRLPGSAEYLLDASTAVMRALGAAEGNIDVEVRVVRFGKHTN